MDFSSATTAVSTVGFPIVFCFYMFWQMNKIDEKRQEQINQLKDVITDMSIAINNNTNVMQQVINKIN